MKTMQAALRLLGIFCERMNYDVKGARVEILLFQEQDALEVANYLSCAGWWAEVNGRTVKAYVSAA